VTFLIVGITTGTHSVVEASPAPPAERAAAQPVALPVSVMLTC
jgi:hypothetical protein